MPAKFIFLFSFLPCCLLGQLDSTYLPIVVINTEGSSIPDEPKITATMGIIDNGPGQINKLSDSFNDYDGEIGIELRGSTSQFIYDKKQYAIETRDALGENNNVSLLGLPTENDWILHAPFGDKSLLRNALAYKLAGHIMAYAPRYRYCEVIINDDYKGVYLLLEKIKRDNDRVDIARLNPDDNAGDQLTGGYILKIDKMDGGLNDGFVSAFPPVAGGSQELFYQYHYPKPADITVAQQDYIRNFIDGFEQTMSRPDYADPENGYQRYIDYITFIDYLLINELTKNVDAYRISTYLYKDRDSIDGRLKMGPVWDFNLAFGNVDFCMGPSPEGWVLDYAKFCPDDFWLRPFYWTPLIQDSTFQAKTKERWTNLRNSVFSNDRIEQCIDSLVEVIGVAQARNFERWPILGTYVWPNAFVGQSYEAEIDYLKDWLQQRLAWMDREMESFGILPYSSTDYFAPLVYPNPSNGDLTFEYYVRRNQEVKVLLYNSVGTVIEVLEDKEHPAGSNEMIWQAPPDLNGLVLYSIYFNEEFVQSGRIFIAQ